MSNQSPSDGSTARIGRTPMPEQDPKVRARNFKEVPLGFTPDMAMREASRCLHCKKPLCREGCPVGVPIPDFLALVAKGDFAAAAERSKKQMLSLRSAAGSAPRRISVKDAAC